MSQQRGGERGEAIKTEPNDFFTESDQPIPAGEKLNRAYVTQGRRNCMDMVILHSFSRAALTVNV